MRKSARGLGLFLIWGLLAPPSPAQTPARAPLPAQAAASRAGLPLETALISYDGFVEVQRAGQQNRQQVRAVPILLEQGDRVHTYRQGEAVIQFKDGSRITLSPYTIFAVELESPSGITLNLALGRLRALVSRLKSREFKVRTSVAVASVRGTEFEVEALGERKSSVSVHDGSVVVANVRGDEVLLTANQRVNVFEDRLGRVEFFQGRPERGADRGKREDRKKEDRRRDERQREERRDERGRMRAALEREVGFAQGRDALESRAAFEQKSALYQEGKTLIDAFGQRVRLEEYMLRPTPESFKFVTLNFRDKRLDKAVFEVTANRPLPKDLKEAGNLWLSPSATKPLFYAVNTRFTMTNGLDSVTRMALDGDALRIEIPGQPVFDETTGAFVFSPGVFHQTVFTHLYEFINGDPAKMDQLYFGNPLSPADRPTDLPSMMWHMVPVRVNILNAGTNTPVLSPVSGQPLHYFDYAFGTVTGAAGAAGKMFVDINFQPDPALAHFVEIRNYLNFQDFGGTGGDGILAFGEKNHPGLIFGVTGGCPSGTGPGCVYDDRAAVGAWDPLLNAGRGGISFLGPALPGAGTQQVSGDTVFFKDANGNNVNDGGDTATTLTGGPKDPALLLFAQNNHRDVMFSDNFVIDDFGTVRPAAEVSSAAGTQENQVNDLFQSFNFERTVTSNRFSGRKIDLVMTPHLFLQAGEITAQQNHSGAPAPGGNPPGN